MKAVGEAVAEGQSYYWDKTGLTHTLRCIGIAPWGYVERHENLISKDGAVSVLTLHDNVRLSINHDFCAKAEGKYKICTSIIYSNAWIWASLWLSVSVLCLGCLITQSEFAIINYIKDKL